MPLEQPVLRLEQGLPELMLLQEVPEVQQGGRVRCLFDAEVEAS